MPGYADALSQIDNALAQYGGAPPPPPAKSPVSGSYSVDADDTPPTPGVRFATPAQMGNVRPLAPSSPAKPAYQMGIDTIDAALASAPSTDAGAQMAAPQAETPVPKSSKPTWFDLPADIGKSLIGGIEQGGAALLSLPRTIRDAAARGENWAIAKVYGLTGQLPVGKTEEDLRSDLNSLDDSFGSDRSDHALLPSTADVQKVIEKVDGPIYQPKTVAGEYARTVGEFIPGAGRSLVAGAVLPGLASEAAGQATKGTGLEPWARVAGGVAGALGGAIAPHSLTPVKAYVEPLTQGGQEAIAARTLGKATTDIPAARAALDQPSEIVRGSVPSAYQQTGDLGLGQLERKQRMSADSAPAYIERDRAQNAARMDALQGIQQSGSPADVAAQFRQMRDALDQQAQERIDALTPAAQDANAAMGGHGTADSTGYALRQPMADARAATKENENRLWGLVNPDGAVPANGISQVARDTKNGVSQSAAPMSDEEARIFDVAAGYPTRQRFGDLKDLRSSITDEIAAARAQGRTQTVRRLGGLLRAVDDALDHGVENQAAMEEIAVRRGLIRPADTMAAKLRPWIESHYARQSDVSLRSVAGGREGAPGAAGRGSIGAPGDTRAASERRSGPRSAPSDQGISTPPGTRPQQPNVRGSIAYQAPDFGDRSVSARMHAPEVQQGTGADIPGTLVRPFGGPLDRAGPSGGKPTGIVAYHGTPHDFDAFSSAHIGTGEGAQAYGHGLYFADNPNVARNYRDVLSARDADFVVGGQKFKRSDLGEHHQGALDHILDSGSVDKAHAESRAQALKDDSAHGVDWTRRMEILQNWMDAGFAKGGVGHLYGVAINRDLGHFLDWHEPLLQQSAYVKDRVAKALGFPDRVAQLPNGNYSLMSGDKQIGREWPLASGARDALRNQQMLLMNKTGAQLYESQKLVPGEYRVPAAASKALSDAGIAGIKYLDQGSRGGGSGSHNYVTFNDHDIQITHKNGVELARPVALPQFLKGQARGAFVKELVEAGMSPVSFSKDLKVRAEKLFEGGQSLDHGSAFERAHINQRLPKDIADAVDSRSAPTSRSDVPRAGGYRNGPDEEGGTFGASLGRRGFGEARRASSETVPSFTPEDVAAYRAATKATRERAQTFDEGTAGRVLQPAGRGGYQMPDAAVPSAVVPRGKPTDALAVRQFMAAGGTPEAIADATAYSIRSATKRLDGTLDPNKVHSWINKNQDALAEMPPEVASRFRNVADTQAAVDEMVKRREADVAAFNKTAIARIANLQHGKDVTKTIGGIFGQKNAVQQMKSLAEAASSDPSARNGLRRAVVEHLLGRLTSNASNNASGVPQIAASNFLGYMRHNGAALRQVFGPGELDMMAAVGRDLDRSLRTHQTKGLTSSPGTAQDLGAAKGSILSELGEKIGPAGFAMASHAAGANVLTSALSFLGAQTIGRMRAAGIASANDLMVKAMLDPALAKKLLAKVPDRPGQGTARALADQFVRLSRATAAGEFASMPDRSRSH